MRFGKLLAIGRAPNGSRSHSARWLCLCDCGIEVITRSDVLTSGSSNSCGCARAALISQANVRHGHSSTPTYRAWINIVRRCTNPEIKFFAEYGGRGIHVCERWLKFENFLADMGARPEGLSIDRINNNGNYEPGNCRWASAKEQARNRRNTKFVSFRGERVPLTEAAERLGISPHSLRAKIRRGQFVEGIVA